MWKKVKFVQGLAKVFLHFVTLQPQTVSYDPPEPGKERIVVKWKEKDAWFNISPA